MHCVICQSENLTEKKKHQAYTLEDCSSCGAQFWWPLKHPGEEYYETSVFRRGRLQWRQRMFLKHPPITKGRVLDIGCGLGNFLEAVHKKYPEIEPWGIDIAENHVDFIKKNCGIEHVYAADLKDFLKRTDLPKFDVVTMFELIEHVESPNELLQDIKKLLAPGGYVVVSTPNLDRITGVAEDEDLPPHHFWRWHPRTLQFTLEHNGFTVTRFVRESMDKDFLYRQLQRIHWFAALKAWVIKKVAPKQKNEASAAPADVIKKPKSIEMNDLKTGDLFVVAKDVGMWIVSIPVVVVGRLFGLKYWDMYIEGRMER